MTGFEKVKLLPFPFTLKAPMVVNVFKLFLTFPSLNSNPAAFSWRLMSPIDFDTLKKSAFA
jgi:hypothetical protein